ncbi:MAG: aldolase [Clostridia bacterium]|jgi:2-dehydro-3-deoxyphosphogluconate aldolase/(4S)-4-hydroxy-2-oxoglutarate aldolase|nr:aldolase [Clostridia bacterium]
MCNSKIKKAIEDKRVIAIIRGVEEKYTSDVVAALAAGGISLLEFTFDHCKPDYINDTINKIKRCKEQFGDMVVVGAGTVLTTEEVEKAVEAGAEFIISPNVNIDIIKRTKELGKISIPGALTPTEVVTAYEAGADYVKLFPAGDLGLSYIKALIGPLEHIPFMVVGGITPDNYKDYLKLGIVGIGVGGQLIDKKAIQQGQFDTLTEIAKKFTNHI